MKMTCIFVLADFPAGTKCSVKKTRARERLLYITSNMLASIRFLAKHFMQAVFNNNMKNIILIAVIQILGGGLPAQVVDSTFGVLGSLFYPISDYYYGVTACDFDGRRDQCHAALHLTDGRIIMAGNSHTQNGGNDIALVRLLPNGLYDQAMGNNGQVRLDLGTQKDTCLTATLYGEHQMILGGGIAPEGTDLYALLLLRTNLNGQVDTTFGNNGSAIIDLPVNRELITELRVLEDSSILVAGNAFEAGLSIDGTYVGQTFMCKLLPNGSVDTTFGENGFIYRHWEDNCNVSVLGDVSVDGFGRVVITGASYDYIIDQYDGDDWCTHNVVVCRYLANGQVDSTFGSNGKVVLNTGNGRGSALLHYEDGRILLVGVAGAPSFNPIYTYLARLMPNGTLDNSFSGDGTVWSTAMLSSLFASGVAEPFGVVRLPGRIVVGGLGGIDNAPFSFGAIAFTEEGKLDSSFAKNGSFTFFEDIGQSVFMNQISSTEEDNFFISGYYYTLYPDNMFIGKVTMSQVSGTSDEHVGNLFSVYPNPVIKGSHTIIDMSRLSAIRTGETRVILRDINGKVILQQSWPEQTDFALIHTADLVSGVYIIELSGSGKRYVRQLVVSGG